jgi:hypothetical protein
MPNVDRQTTAEEIVMSHGTFARHGFGVLTATSISIVAGAALAPAAAALPVEQYIEVAQCQPATGQHCPQIPEVPFTNDLDKGLQAQFTANAAHCSDLDVRFLVDGYPQGDWHRVGPGQTVYSEPFIKQGAHRLGVTAKGIEGGCNTGVLHSWGGTVRLNSS